jgi:hypothetical protein
MKVMRNQCATCIFRPGNPMDLRSGRVHEMVAMCRQHDTHIPCHERLTTITEIEGLSEINLDDPVCRGFYDAYPGVGQMIRISGRLRLIKEID